LQCHVPRPYSQAAQRRRHRAYPQAAFRGTRSPKTHRGTGQAKLADSAKNSATDSDTCVPTKSISKTPTLHWQQVNEVTLKLCGDEMVRVPAVHGYWGGFNTAKALAWLIGVGWVDPAGGQRWVARVEDWRFGPTSLARVKTAALARVMGKPTPPQLLGVQFSMPLDVLGGQLRWPGTPCLDRETAAEICRQEIGARAGRGHEVNPPPEPMAITKLAA